MSNSTEINLAKIIASVKSNILGMVLIVGLTTILGVMYSLSINNYYKTNIKFLSESENNNDNSNLNGLAGLTGIRLNTNNSNEIKSDLYPFIISSTPFLIRVLNSDFIQPITQKRLKIKDIYSDSNKSEAKSNKQIEGYKYYDEIKNESQIDYNLVELLRSSINFEIEKKSGLFIITTTAGDPFLAAAITSIVYGELKNYILNTSSRKNRGQLNYINKSLRIAQKRYDNALYNLSLFKDSNRNLFLNTLKDREIKLKNEVDLSFKLYSTLKSQQEEIQLKLANEVTIFKIVEPIRVPVEKEGPKRSLITLGFMFAGIFFSLIYVFFKTVNLKELLG